MFRDTRKRRLRNRIIFAAIGVFILSFGIWLNQREALEESNQQMEQSAQDVVKKVKTEAEKKSASEGAEGNQENRSDSQGEQTGTEDAPESYLIKEVDGVVKVFLCNEDGDKELYLITSIPFDLLSESDQQLFVDGVELETEEDLGEFLENFDS